MTDDAHEPKAQPNQSAGQAPHCPKCGRKAIEITAAGYRCINCGFRVQNYLEFLIEVENRHR